MVLALQLTYSERRIEPVILPTSPPFSSLLLPAFVVLNTCLYDLIFGCLKDSVSDSSPDDTSGELSESVKSAPILSNTAEHPLRSSVGDSPPENMVRLSSRAPSKEEFASRESWFPPCEGVLLACMKL